MVRRARSFIRICLALAIGSCQPDVRSPSDVRPGGPLRVSAEPTDVAGRAPSGPVRVLFHSPDREIDGNVEITATFDRPMVEIDRADAVQPSPLRIEPAIEGEVRWLGSRTATFVPRGALPSATELQVRIPAGTRALDGNAVREEVRWSFWTPGPSVARVDPYDGAGHQLPGREVDLWFDQRMTPQAVQAAARFHVTPDDGATIDLPAIAASPDPEDPKRVRVRAPRPFPANARITLALDRSLRGVEGPIQMGRAWSTSFRTYGPFGLQDQDVCPYDKVDDGCNPDGWTALRFTNPVRLRDARRSVVLTPAVPMPDLGDDDTFEIFSLGRGLRPRTTYRVTIRGDLRDTFGQPFSGPRTWTFRVGAYRARAELALDGRILESTAAGRVAARVANIGRARLLVQRIEPRDLHRTIAEVGWGSEMTAKLAGRPGVTDQTLDLHVGPAERRMVPLDVRPALRGGKGLVVVEFGSDESENEYYRYRRAIVAVTDLGATVKISPRGALVWVTRLRDGRPVAGARVTVYGRGGTPIDAGTTDASGVATVAGDRLWGGASVDEYEAEDTLFVATTGDDATYVQGFEGGVNPWSLHVPAAWDQGNADVEGHLFVDRGVYRPGDRVRLKGTLRRWTDRGLELVRGSVDLEIKDSQGEPFDHGTVALSEFGTFVREARIPANAPLGSLRVQARFGGRTFEAWASIEEFRPAEFEVAVEPDRERHVRGETLRFAVDGNYLFGAPMTGATTRWTAIRGPADLSIPRHEAFSIGNEARWLEEETEADTALIGEGRGELDQHGRLEGEVALALPRLDGPERVTIEATTEGLGGDSIAGRASSLLLPAEFLVAVKPLSTFVTAGASVEAEVVAVNPDGERRPGVALRGELVRHEWRSVRRASEGGAYSFVNTRTEQPVGHCAMSSRAEPSSCRIRVARPGVHTLRVHGRDAHGNEVSTSVVVWATGPGGYGWSQEAGPAIELRSDRRQYRIGETARILVPSPFAQAEALVTVERAGVISREWKHVEGNTPTIEVPVTDSFVPNAFVSVVLVRGRTAPPVGDDDPGKPDFRVGTIELGADAEAHHLRVSVEPDAERKHPGDDVRVRLRVRDVGGHGVPAELAVFAVDEGVLSLTGYATPDPFTEFYRARGLSVRTADARAVLMTPVPPEGTGDKGDESGGGGGEGGVRTRFDAVAYWNGGVRTGADGSAEVSFRLPENTTTYRLMAVAVSRGADAGHGEGRVQTAKPVLLRAMLPRFLRAGDHADAGVVVHSKGAGSGTARVAIEADGVRVEGPTAREVALEEGGGAEVRFALHAERPGTAKLRFRVALGRWRDAIEVTREVRLPGQLETVATYGDTEGSVDEAVAPAEGIRHDVGALELELSSSALVGLGDPIRELLDYPYECAEQLTSKLIPLVAFRELAVAYGLARPADLDRRIERTLDDLQRKQRPDGSFALWEGFPSVRELDVFLTAYAMLGLHTAASRSAGDTRSAVEHARAWLASSLRAEERAPSERRLSNAVKAFVVYAMAATGAPEPQYVAYLFEHRTELPLWAKVLLAHAIHLGRGDATQVRLLVGEVANATRQTAAEAHLEENLGDGYDVVMHSEARATAMWLRLLLDVEPRHPLVPKLARWLVGMRRADGAWGNTQETTFALLAMSDFYRIREAVRPDFEARVAVAGRALATTRFRGRSLRVEHARIPVGSLPARHAPIQLSREGAGTLHYALRLRYARATLPATPLDRGIVVDRSYERLEAGSLTAGARPTGTRTGSFTAGDLVRVTLHLVVPQRRSFVVVDDPVPAGFEIVNFALRTATQSWRAGGDGETDDEPVDRDADWGDVSWDSAFQHRENRDDRVVLAASVLEPGTYRYEYVARAVTPGRFVVPPTQAEEMYRPENFGRTGAARIAIEERR